MTGREYITRRARFLYITPIVVAIGGAALLNFLRSRLTNEQEIVFIAALLGFIMLWCLVIWRVLRCPVCRAFALPMFGLYVFPGLGLPKQLTHCTECGLDFDVELEESANQQVHRTQ